MYWAARCEAASCRAIVNVTKGTSLLVEGGDIGTAGGKGRNGEATKRHRALTSELIVIFKGVGQIILAILYPVVIGFGIAMAIYTYGSTGVFQSRIDAVGDNVWLFAAVLVIGRTIGFVNIDPTIMWKTHIMGKVR